MRILIAGLGAIGQRHARNLRRLCGKDLELLAVRHRGLRHVVTDTLQRDDSVDCEAALGIRSFPTLDDALEQRPDVAFVCTPSSRHLEIAGRAVAAGCHVFIEKPLSNAIDGLERLENEVNTKGLVAMVGCQWRFHPLVRWLRETLDAGALGRISAGSVSYDGYLPDWHPYEDYRLSYAARADLGGGVVLTQIHDYDLAWWLFGQPQSVRASGGHLSELEIDVEDTVDACLEGDAPVRVHQSFATKSDRRSLTVVGERGTVAVDLLAGIVTSTVRMSPPPVEGYERNNMFTDEAEHFLNCIRRSLKPAVTLADGEAVLRIALAVKDAIRTGREERVSRRHEC